MIPRTPFAGIAEYYNRLATFGILPSEKCFAAAKDAALKASEHALRLDHNTFWGLFSKAMGLPNQQRFAESEATAELLLEVSDQNPVAQVTRAISVDARS